jgi:hypothetical protein
MYPTPLQMEAYNEATVEAEYLMRKHKLYKVGDYELEALIDLLMLERDCRTYAHNAEAHQHNQAN